MTKAVELAQVASAGVSEGFKNRIINGDMRIDQRSAGAAVTVGSNSSSFIVDRFRGDSPFDQSMTYQQQTAVVPAGFLTALKVTASTATTNTSNQPTVVTFIEGYNIADLNWGGPNAKTVTLSFQVYSSLTGTFGVCFENGSATRGYIASYTINSANTWETKTITVVGDTGGIWEATNQRGLAIFFDLGYGTTFSNPLSTSWASTGGRRGLTGGAKLAANTGATWYITGLQLEVGTTATSFDTRSIGTELVLCERYFQKTYALETARGTATASNCYSVRNQDSTSARSAFAVPLSWKVDMRASPTFTVYTINGTSGSVSIDSSPASQSSTSTIASVSGTGSKGIAGFDVSSTVGALNFFSFQYTAESEL